MAVYSFVCNSPDIFSDAEFRRDQFAMSTGGINFSLFISQFLSGSRPKRFSDNSPRGKLRDTPSTYFVTRRR